jgi:hypothetical protein
MKARVPSICFAVSLLLNVIAIPTLLWNLWGYQMMQRQTVDYVSELAYTIGYHKGLGNNLVTELELFPTRLQITEVNSNSVEALIWPAKQQSISLEFSDPKICYATVFTGSDAPSSESPNNRR